MWTSNFPTTTCWRGCLFPIEWSLGCASRVMRPECGSFCALWHDRWAHLLHVVSCLPSQVYVWGKPGNVEVTAPGSLFSRYLAAAFGWTWPQEWPGQSSLFAEGEKNPRQLFCAGPCKQDAFSSGSGEETKVSFIQLQLTDVKEEAFIFLNYEQNQIKL